MCHLHGATGENFALGSVMLANGFPANVNYTETFSLSCSVGVAEEGGGMGICER